MYFNENEFVFIPGGRYSVGISRDTVKRVIKKLTGSPLKEGYITSAYPRHDVDIDDVYIGKQPVSSSKFREFVLDTGYVTEAEKDGWGWIWNDKWIKREKVSWKKPAGDDSDSAIWNNGAFPVMQVSWNDANEYCKWLSKQFSRGVRLPREYEWEVFASMAGVSGIDTVNDATFENRDNELLIKALAGADKSTSGHFTGIVWEWTEDWYERYPGGEENSEYGTVYKVLRGGSLLSHYLQRSREFRLRKCPTARSPYYGFRIAVE